MPASTTTKRFAPGNCLTSTTFVSSTPGRPHQHAAGLDRHLQAAAARRADQGAHIRRRVGHRAAVVRNPQPAAHVEMLQLDAFTAERVRERHDRLRRLLERLERGDLRADVNVRADRLQAAPSRHLAKQRRRFVDRHAELVRLEPRGDVRMALRVDVGIDAQRHPRPHVLRDGALIDPIELAGRLDVDRQQSERHRAIDLGGALADAGEHDLIGTETAAQRDVHFAKRIGVGVAAERLQEPHHGQRRIRLQRVVNGVRIAVERVRRGSRRRRGWRPRRRRSRASRRRRRCRRAARSARLQLSRKWWRPLPRFYRD